MLEVRGNVELIPAAGRLISSLRDMGYEFATAVADLVDNSIEAGASVVDIDIQFEGEESWVRIADNGCGMSPMALQEAMRYGSNRAYSDSDLGKFGLGLKVASLSQCQRLTVASRRIRERLVAYCWDLDHIRKTNRWELLPTEDWSGRAHSQLVAKESAGTVVLWERLDRILGYKIPDGESARRRLANMCRDVAGHLAMVFHRFLSGEVRGKRLRIILNGSSIPSWDPFARNERATRRLDPVRLKFSHEGSHAEVTIEPFVLPHQADFSSPEKFKLFGGPSNWNQQQGFYVYRSDRLIQCGGWCRIRSIDEHTKLARVALRFNSQLDEVFRVNVSKMKVELPSWMRDQIAEAMAPVLKAANEAYRKSAAREDSVDGRPLIRVVPNSKQSFGDLTVNSLLAAASTEEKRIIRQVAARVKRKHSTH